MWSWLYNNSGKICLIAAAVAVAAIAVPVVAMASAGVAVVGVGTAVASASVAVAATAVSVASGVSYGKKVEIEKDNAAIAKAKAEAINAQARAKADNDERVAVIKKAAAENERKQKEKHDAEKKQLEEKNSALKLAAEVEKKKYDDLALKNQELENFNKKIIEAEKNHKSLIERLENLKKDVAKQDDTINNISTNVKAVESPAVASKPETKKNNSSDSSSKQPNKSSFFSALSQPHAVIKCCGNSYIRHPVLEDGDCGYTSFCIDRKQAYQFLRQKLPLIRDIIRPVIFETLKTNLDFANSLIDEEYAGVITDSKNYLDALIHQDPDLQKFEDNLARHANNLTLILEYIDFDVKDGKIDNGWCHPLILFALAEIRGIHLYLYREGVNGSMVPHSQYPEYHPQDVVETPINTMLLLFNLEGNHFEKVELMGSNNEIASHTSSQAGNNYGSLI